MDKRVLIICRGIQGSGKSTWAKQWCHEDPEHRVRFNNDDVRNMLGDYWVPSRENIETLEPGVSPLSVIDARDKVYEMEQYSKNNDRRRISQEA